MNKHIFIYVDESGTLPDPKGPIIVIAAVATYSINQLILPSKSASKSLFRNNGNEIKFYKSGDKTKKKFLTVLSKSDIQIFALILEKHGQKIPDTPENFAAICSFILHDCLDYYQNSVISIIFDRHFHNPSDLKKFDAIIKKISNRFEISRIKS